MKAAIYGGFRPQQSQLMLRHLFEGHALASCVFRDFANEGTPNLSPNSAYTAFS